MDLQDGGVHSAIHNLQDLTKNKEDCSDPEKETSHCGGAANKLADALDPWEMGTQVNNWSAQSDCLFKDCNQSIGFDKNWHSGEVGGIGNKKVCHGWFQSQPIWPTS